MYECYLKGSNTYSFQPGWVRVAVTCRPSAAIPRRQLPSSITHWPLSSLCWHQNTWFGTEVSQTLVQKYETVCHLQDRL